MIVCIDFDNTIHDAKNPIPNKRMGKPIEGVAEALARFRDRHDKVIIFSSNNESVIADYMKYYNLYYDEIKYKPHADVYIDDKALRFTTWPEMMKLVLPS